MSTSAQRIDPKWPTNAQPHFRLIGSLADRLLSVSKETGIPPRQILANSLKIHLNFIEDKLLASAPLEQETVK